MKKSFAIPAGKKKSSRLNLERMRRYRAGKRIAALSTKPESFYFLFLLFLFISERAATHTAAASCTARMKARHQFKKSTPLVVAGKKCGPLGGGWHHQNPCQNDRERRDLSLVE